MGTAQVRMSGRGTSGEMGTETIQEEQRKNKSWYLIFLSICYELLIFGWHHAECSSFISLIYPDSTEWLVLSSIYIWQSCDLNLDLLGSSAVSAPHSSFLRFQLASLIH